MLKLPTPRNVRRILFIYCAMFTAAQSHGASSEYIDLPQQNLASALQSVGATMGVAVAFDPAVVGQHTAPAIRGNYAPDNALGVLLQDSGLELQQSFGGAYVVAAASAASTTATTSKRDSAPPVATQRIPVSEERSTVISIEEIIVTAQKRAQSLQDTPVAITALSSRDLAVRGIRNISNLAAIAPNVQVAPSPSNSNSKSTIAIRGSVTTNPAITWEPTVGVYLDGVFVSKAAGIAFNISDPERIEILRGPQGTLYGKNTMGGAVNIITKKPSDEFGGWMRIGYGNYNFHDFYGSMNFGSINIGEAGKFKSKLTLSRQDRDGFYENSMRYSTPISDPFGQPFLHNPNPVNSRDHNELKARAGRLDLLWQFGEDIDVRYVFDKNIDNNTPSKPQLTYFDPNDIAFGFALPAELSGYVISKNKNAKRSPSDAIIREPLKTVSHSFFIDYQAGSTPILGDVILKYLSNYRKLNYSVGLDLDGTPFEIFHNGRFQQTAQSGEYIQRSHEVQIIGSKERVDYVLGLYRFSEDADVVDPLLPFNQFIGPAAIINKTGNIGKQHAVFGQVDYRPMAEIFDDRVTLTVGARWTREKKSAYQSHLDPLSPPESSFSAHANDSWNNSIFTFIVTYNLSSDTNIYTKYAEGFKAGGFNSESENAADFKKGYNPEKVKSFELGLKSRFWEQRIQLNSAVFYNKESDLQLSVFHGGTNAASHVVNAGKSIKAGVELEAIVQVADDLRLFANYGYLHARYKEYMEEVEVTPGEFKIIDNKKNKDNPYAPHYIYNIGLEYDVMHGDWGRARLHVDYSYQDDYVAYANKPSNRTLRFDGFGILNTRLSIIEIPTSKMNFEFSVWGKIF